MSKFLPIFVAIIVVTLICYCDSTTDSAKDAINVSSIEDEVDLKILADDAIDFAQNNGLIIRTNDHPTESDISAFAAFTLFPTQFPRKQFHQAYDVQEAMSLLYFRISRDYDFLVKIASEITKNDYAVEKMLEIVQKIHEEAKLGKINQPISLVLQRSDYMCHMNPKAQGKEDQYQLKQIEVNNGPIGAILVERVRKLHQRMLAKANMDGGSMLPENRPFNTIAEGIYLAWQQFKNPNAIVVTIIGSKRNRFRFEQAQLEYELERISENKIKNIVYMNMNEAHESLRLAEDNSLMLGDRVVGVVYFRRGFLIKPHPLADQQFVTRLLIERSTAIKSPTVALELASMKKIQQVLAKPNMVEHFFPNPEDADKMAAIRATFAKLWGLEKEDAETETVIQDAIAHPENYVLKPNREGGGHNYWGHEISEKLRVFSMTDRKEHILMERLRPFVAQNYPIRAGGDVRLENIVTEFSTYGYLVGNIEDGEVLYNKGHGHLMRTKIEGVTEGGILEGSGFYDSPYLID